MFFVIAVFHNSKKCLIKERQLILILIQKSADGISDISADVRCEIYVMPSEDSSIFMDLLSRDEL